MHGLKKPRTARLVWGIILAAIGLCGFEGVATTDKVAALIVGCIIFLIVGGLMIFFYIRSMKAYKKQLAADEELRRLEQEEIKERLKAQKELREQNRQDRAQQKWEEENATHICPNCGAAVKGHFCDYCGTMF